MAKYDLAFSSPLLNAAGSLGFAPAPRGPVDLSTLGAFVTNPVSLRARSPAQGERLLTFPGGFLLHTGHPNPGLRQTLRRYRPAWARSALPVWVHLLATSPSEVAEMALRLESLEGASAIELGLPPDITSEGALAMIAAGTGELPLVVRLPLERAAELAPAMVGSPIAAVSLGPPRGALPGPTGDLVHGRLYGPAVFPLALEAIQGLAALGLAVIGAGGIYRPEQARAMLAAGAQAVQLDSVLWQRGLEGWKNGSLEA